MNHNNNNNNYNNDTGMNKIEKTTSKSSTASSFSMPDIHVIKGLVAIILGAILLMMSYRIIMNMIFFFVGALLIYYGLVMLKMGQATRYIDSIIDRIRKFVSM